MPPDDTPRDAAGVRRGGKLGGVDWIEYGMISARKKRGYELGLPKTTEIDKL